MEFMKVQGVGDDEKIADAMHEYEKLYTHWMDFAEKTGDKVKESLLKVWDEQKDKYNVWLGITNQKPMDFGGNIDFKQMIDKSWGDLRGITGAMIPKDIEKNVEFPSEAFQNWLKFYTETFEIVLKSPAFVTFLGVMLDSSMDMKKKNEDTAADIIRTLGLPSRKDMDALYKRVHELTQKINSQSQALKNLERGKAR